jgi:site-specific DNA-methyltransferase (adenine-specific)/adenine-specific DNA-methyltransferase
VTSHFTEQELEKVKKRKTKNLSKNVRGAKAPHDGTANPEDHTLI